ncbi:MAG: hypothetical protein H6597_08285 [Flavobacteriales bacterium]|nr:hypothetical protein [Flavobacteriales bacterium]MCB9194513.1 hypothetical protein [Flavobacteriales bacterium]
MMNGAYIFAKAADVHFISCATDGGGLDLFLREACGDPPAQAAAGRDASSILWGLNRSMSRRMIRFTTPEAVSQERVVVQ